MTPEPVRLHLRSPEQTEALAAQFAALSGAGDLLLLTGGIGAGKTVFARGFARALGVAEPVTSPTFVLHSIYASGRLAMNHFDLYRLEAQEEVDELAIWEFMEDAVTLVEWADRSGEFAAPFVTLAFELAPAETERWVTITATGEPWRERLERLGFAPASFVTSAQPILLAVEASTRAPSCAVLAGGRVFERTAPAKPVEDLAGLIVQTLADAGIGLAEVGQLVVGVGPGSYMGVRAAVSTANALSFATGLPVTGVVSTDALAVLAPDERPAITVRLHAGRGRVFVAHYARGGDGGLQRDALPVLRSADEWMAERAGGAAAHVIVDDGMPSDAGPEPQRHALLASGVLRVYVEQPHLLVAGEPAGAVPILPPATIGAGR